MPRWTAFPYATDLPTRDLAALRADWPRLHRGDAEPLPTDEAVLAAWSLYHAGHFEQARDAGLEAGGAGITVANRAQALYALYLEPSERTRLQLLLEVEARARAQAASQPACAAAHYWAAYALGRYSQAISVSQALSQGLGQRVKAGLETTIALAPLHAEAHFALGVFHAEVIDKAGTLRGITQGADAATGLRLFRRGLELNPEAIRGRVEMAAGLLMLEGDKRLADAEALYVAAAGVVPVDAAERLDVEMAKAELAA